MSYPVVDTLTPRQALEAPYLPGFQRGEQVIAKAWIASEGLGYDALGFNVWVGQGVSAPPGAPEYARRFVQLTTQKRIDIVGFQGATFSARFELASRPE